MVAWVKQAVSTPVCDNPRNLLLDGRTVGLDRSTYPLRDITASMRLADGDRVVDQTEVGNPGTCRGDNKGDIHEDIDGNGEDTGRFPNVQKKFWKPAAWQSLSAPPSPTPVPLTPSFGFGDVRKAFPLTPRLQQQSGKVRPPPLQPPRRSTEGNGGFDEGSQWLPATPGGRRDIRNIIGPEMKLDLGAVQRNRDNCEPTEMQLKRDKFAFFDKECSQILKHIYLGSDAVARNRDTLRQNGITHVLNCVGFVCPEYFPGDLSYKTLWLQDSPSEDITSVLYDVFDYFEEVQQEGGRVFVHCCQGVSRSTSLVIAYLMWRNCRSFEDAFQDVKAARGVTNPNMGFACQLLQCQKRVHAAPVSPNSVLRMYRMAPHSKYDPLHLVPKTMNHPCAGALDSRGAFVVHVPNALFVWQGSQCDNVMESAAHHFTGQVVRYERAQGRIILVTEGREPPEFWEALKKGGSQGIKSFINQDVAVGKENGSPKTGRVGDLGTESGLLLKKVPAFDGDFDIYRSAKNGNLVPKVSDAGIMTHVPRDSGWSRLQRRFSLSGSKALQSRETSDLGAKPQDRELTAKVKPESPEVPEEGWLSNTEGSRPSSSPDTSQYSSASPFSLYSFSSSSSQSPPFLTSPCMSPPPSPSPSLSHTPSPNSSLMWSPTSSRPCSPPPPPIHTSNHISFPMLDHLPTQQDIKSLHLPPQGPTPSLAERRRGSLLPSLSLPGLADEPPATPSRNPQLPPSLTEKFSKVRDPMLLEGSESGCSSSDVTETYKPGYIDCEKNVKGCDWGAEPVRSRGRAQLEDIAETSYGQRGSGMCNDGSTGRSVVPSLFVWPRMEKIEMFDSDDLDPDAAFVLLVPDASDGRGGQLFLWVGASLRSKAESIDLPAQDGNLRRHSEQDWQNIGVDLARQLHLRQDLPVQVVKAGSEPSEFWENFING